MASGHNLLLSTSNLVLHNKVDGGRYVGKWHIVIGRHSVLLTQWLTTAHHKMTYSTWNSFHCAANCEWPRERRGGVWESMNFHPDKQIFQVPGVPLSWDKGRSKNPGTNSTVPGRPGTKSLSQKQHKKQEKDVPKQKKDVLKQEKDVLKQKRTF